MDFLSASFTKLWLPLFERVLRLLLLARPPPTRTVPALQLVVVPVLVTVAVLIVVAASPGCC